MISKERGRVWGIFGVLSPFERVEISDLFSRKIGGLKGDFSIPRFLVW